MSILPSNSGSTPSTHAVAVSPSDSADLASVTKGVWVGGVGDLKVTMFGGEAVVFTAVPAGTYLPIAVKRIWSTGTSASNIAALWE